MNVYDGIWTYMKVCKGILRYMKAYEGIWEHIRKKNTRRLPLKVSNLK